MYNIGASIIRGIQQAIDHAQGIGGAVEHRVMVQEKAQKLKSPTPNKKVKNI